MWVVCWPAVVLPQSFTWWLCSSGLGHPLHLVSCSSSHLAHRLYSVLLSPRAHSHTCMFILWHLGSCGVSWRQGKCQLITPVDLGSRAVPAKEVLVNHWTAGLAGGEGKISTSLSPGSWGLTGAQEWVGGRLLLSCPSSQGRVLGGQRSREITLARPQLVHD